MSLALPGIELGTLCSQDTNQTTEHRIENLRHNKMTHPILQCILWKNHVIKLLDCLLNY